VAAPPRFPPGFPPLPSEVPAAESAVPLHGGDVAEVWDVWLADGRRVVVKQGPTDATLEAEGLDVLRDAGAPTPRVVGVDGGVLVLDHVGGPGDLHALGRELATAHRRTGQAFGWHRDNVIGPLPQANPWTEHWPTFFIEQRITPYLDVLPGELARRLEAACAGPLPDLLDHDAPPSLVHGDLWSGNIVGDRWLIDPAVHHADRELDLAMLALFGGVPAELQAGYDEVWPLDDGWQHRRPALQLYHLLVHVRLFGAGYVGAVASRLDRIGT
jgi:fructosamine-3-kinase